MIFKARLRKYGSVLMCIRYRLLQKQPNLLYKRCEFYNSYGNVSTIFLGCGAFGWFRVATLVRRYGFGDRFYQKDQALKLAPTCPYFFLYDLLL